MEMGAIQRLPTTRPPKQINRVYAEEELDLNFSFAFVYVLFVGG